MKIDYNNSLTNLSNSILKYFGCETHHESLEVIDKILEEDKPKNVVLILCDGMGSKILDYNLNENDFLRKNKLTDISSVFPPTTTAATTTIQTGLNPCEHGLLGWDQYIKPEDKVITLYMNTIKDTDIVFDYNIINKYLPFTTISDHINEKHSANEIFTHRLKSERAFWTALNKTKEYCDNSGKQFIYLYNDEPDHTCHELGYDHPDVVGLYKKINNEAQNFYENLKDTTVIITADHGHITSEPIILINYPDIFSMLDKDISIEGRACNFFIKEDKKEEFVVLFNKYFSSDFDLLTKEEVINNHLFGYGNEHPLFRDSLGDYLAIAKTNKYFRYDNKGLIFK
jgi:predicted AlkP superfamily pyrophosphatase or phosphodiesterase